MRDDAGCVWVSTVISPLARTPPPPLPPPTTATNSAPLTSTPSPPPWPSRTPSPPPASPWSPTAAATSDARSAPPHCRGTLAAQTRLPCKRASSLACAPGPPGVVKRRREQVRDGEGGGRGVAHVAGEGWRGSTLLPHSHAWRQLPSPTRPQPSHHPITRTFPIHHPLACISIPLVSYHHSPHSHHPSPITPTPSHASP